ncbi:MAG TPA: DMT family transporter [Bacteroidales bacterium]|nr:DMT family transporter [Bacteroidales bacterium]
MLRSSTLRSDLLLLLAAVIWGFAFVAQRMGMDHIGPFLFNAIRFALGAGVMVVVHRITDRRLPTADRRLPTADRRLPTADRRLPTIYGILLGLILFAGATFQQVGIVYTTAGNAGFITGLYVILVPVFGIFSGQKARVNLWGGALIATVGMYFLSVTEAFSISKGDLFVLTGAVFWAVHVLYTGWVSPKVSAIRLAAVQYAVCALLSLFAALIFEKNTLSGIYDAAIPLLYGGFLSVGVAFTLQIVGQKKAPPAHAAIILSLEAVFAVVGGMLILSETMTDRKWFGCALMLAGMLLAQVKSRQSAVSSQQSAVSSKYGEN